MTPVEWIFMLGVVGVVLLVAELFLPTHGLVGVLGIGALVAAVVMCFVVDQWLGVTALVAGLLATPVAGFWFGRLWPKSFLGRRLVLQPEVERIILPPVRLGEQGVTVTELRPGGVCEFGAERLEATSDRGMISAGRRVVVVGLTDRRPTVRAVEPDARGDVSAGI